MYGIILFVKWSAKSMARCLEETSLFNTRIFVFFSQCLQYRILLTIDSYNNIVQLFFRIKVFIFLVSSVNESRTHYYVQYNAILLNGVRAERSQWYLVDLNSIWYLLFFFCYRNRLRCTMFVVTEGDFAYDGGEISIKPTRTW